MAEGDLMAQAETDVPARLKQACLDVSNAALTLFDQIDEHGTEAPWIGTNVLNMRQLAESYEQIRSYFFIQAEMRLRRLRALPDDLFDDQRTGQP